MPDTPLSDLYPDIKQHGSLGRFLSAEFKRIGSPLTATGFDEAVGGSSYRASVRENNRNSEIALAMTERLFLAPFWINGVQLASIKTTSTDVLVRALHTWFVERCSAKDLKVAFPTVTVSAGASFYEAGPKAFVEFRWAELLGSTSETRVRLYPVMQLAYNTPAFRQLLPYTSLGTLCFSRCTGYPFTYDGPSIEPSGEDRFRVIGPPQESLGEGSAEKAVEIALAHLPEDCGPAIHGTAENLSRA